jgi:flagellar motor switch/type III secretory pathway protein FliN
MSTTLVDGVTLVPGDRRGDSRIMIPRPYPWATVPRVSRSSSELLSAIRRALTESTPARAVVALAELVGEPVVVSIDQAGPGEAPTLSSHSVPFRLMPPDSRDVPGWWVVVEVELALVVALVARAMRRPSPRVVHAGVATPAMKGAFAAILASSLRRAGVPAVAAPLDDPKWVTAERTTVANCTVEFGGYATHLRAVFPEGLARKTGAVFQRRDAADLGDLSLTLPIVACRTTALAREVAVLAVDDVWLLGAAWRLGPAASPRGRVSLVAPSSERAAAADVEVGGRIVLREEVEELGWWPMNERHDEAEGGLVDVLGDVPVVVRIELGVATLKAREWSALRPGDVISAGGKLGAPVTLRVSGLAVAEGELVDLEGEVGVRIRRRLST